MSSENQTNTDATQSHISGHDLAPLYARTGALGKAFLDAFTASAAKEIVDPFYYHAVARFNAHKEIDGFENTITYGARALGNHDGFFKDALSQIFNSRNHEGTHAIDFNRCAALHLTGFNPHSRFLLLPEDEIRLMEMKERNAISRAWLLHQVHDGVLPGDDADTLQHALFTHAQTVLEAQAIDGRPALDYYRSVALRECATMVPKRLMQYGKDIVFVTLSDQDWLEIGRSFDLAGGGRLATFGTSPADLSRFISTPLDAGHQDCLRDLRASLPIPLHAVPFDAALHARGLDQAAFLRQSLVYHGP